MRNDDNAHDDGSLTWLLHDLIDQNKINAGDAVKISQRSELRQIPPIDVAEFIINEYQKIYSFRNLNTQQFYINAMRQALQDACGPGNLPLARQGADLVCRFRTYAGFEVKIWENTHSALEHFRTMENIIMRIPAPVIKAHESVNKQTQQLALILMILSSFNVVPITEFITRMRALDSRAMQNLISGLSAISLLMTGELEAHGEHIARLLNDVQFIANE